MFSRVQTVQNTLFKTVVNSTTNYGLGCGINVNNIPRRYVSSSEVASALRPFYFAVHPDLFGRHPKERSVNEESLKHLSAYLESIQKSRTIHTLPKVLNFYVRDTTSSSELKDSLKLIRVQLNGMTNIKGVVKTVLKSCNLSTESADKMKEQSSGNSSTSNHRHPSSNSSFYRNSSPFSETSQFEDFEWCLHNRKEEEQKTLKTFLKKNIEIARERKKGADNLQEEIKKLQERLIERLQLKDIRYECGWNFEHYRGCLKTLERLMNLHEKDLRNLKGRVVVFAPFTGISLEGHVMLFTGDVLRNWIYFIRDMPKHDAFLEKIPAYEYALSQVLRSIKIARRKFMPKEQASRYADHLRQVTTTLLDYLSKQKYPKSWPSDLKEYEIVIESEAGPLMISPTGQIIAPASCPGSILIDFLTKNFDEAHKKAGEYKRNKYVERELHRLCIEQLKLKSLTKDDSVTPDRMIKSLEKLVTSKVSLNNVNLNITNYYSILSDGTVCIPWDYRLE